MHQSASAAIFHSYIGPFFCYCTLTYGLPREFDILCKRRDRDELWVKSSRINVYRVIMAKTITSNEQCNNSVKTSWFTMKETDISMQFDIGLHDIEKKHM